MARRSGGTHKGVEEKRRSLPIYDHYTLSPGKTKSHHPEAKCNHCHKEFVCGSKQRLIRHLRKCNNITNPEHIIAETLNTLARNSATGQLNHSILEASNLLPSQIHHLHHTATTTTSTSHLSPTSSLTTANNISNSNHNTSGSSSNDTGLIAISAAAVAAAASNGSSHPHQHLVNAMSLPLARKAKRGRKPANQLMVSSQSGIHVSTGLDGKTHFTPTSQLPPNVITAVGQGPIMVHPAGNGRHSTGTIGTTTSASGTPLPNSGHLTCATTSNHHHGFKLNTDPIDKAYLKLVLTRNLPLSLCDTKEFQLWVKTFSNDYKPPTSISLITNNLKNEAQVARQRVSNILVKAFKKTINLEMHSWPDEDRGHLWYAVIANIDLKRFLISVKDIQPTTFDATPTTTTTTTETTNLDSATNPNNRQLLMIDTLANFLDECIKRVGSDRINSLVFSQINGLTSRAKQTLYTTHPSIVTYQCWWNFTNTLCSDLVEYNDLFRNVLRNSDKLMNSINKRPKLSNCLEKFNPFVRVGSPNFKCKSDRRWYSHLICYLLEYIKNNNDAIIRALDNYQSLPVISSDNNNNSSGNGIIQHNSSTQQQNITCPEDTQLIDVKSIVMSSNYWADLELALFHLKPFQDILALTSTVSAQSINTNSNATSNQILTPPASSTIHNALLLSEYMNWFINYGKTLFSNWRHSPDNLKYRLVERYLNRFVTTISDFKLPFAAYLLNPKYRCAYTTQAAKNIAIEEILNIASEFMPEESDGHTIFDQWRLYLVREEPYDAVFEESRTTPLEWWLSLPCAESIRRVAVRILRLRAFASTKPGSLFSQLYNYEDEAYSSLNDSTFEDIAILRYFYDYEDKVGQSIHNLAHNHQTNTTNNLTSLNGYHDRAQVGQLHSENPNQSDYTLSYMQTNNLHGSSIDVKCQVNNSTESGVQTFIDSYSDLNSYPLEHHNNSDVSSNLSIEDLQDYRTFLQYIDFNETGVQINEEPIEKKKRKWTAQEILSKCQSNHQINSSVGGK